MYYVLSFLSGGILCGAAVWILKNRIITGLQDAVKDLEARITQKSSQ